MSPDPEETIAHRTDRPRGKRASGDDAPSHVGPLRIERVLGRGGMGVVYLATDTRLDRPVAVKAMAPHVTGHEDYRQRFEREARVLGAISHPHVATLHGLEREGDALYLVLEYLDGEGLDERLARGAVGVEEACEIAAQVADGLAAAHSRGVIHRDLKPANVRSTSYGSWKVLDFGLARHVGRGLDALELTSAGTPVGTPVSMSPEQVLGCELDETVDLWGLGCVLYQCLTGRRPFSGRSVGELERAILGEAPDWACLPDGVPEGVRSLLVACLDKEPSRRWRSASDARRVLRGELEPVSRVSSRASQSTPRGMPRQLTSFVGRSEELGRATEALLRSALVTLTGAGGCGKTRLAIAAVQDPRVRERFDGGAIFIDLSPLTVEALVARTIAGALGLRESPSTGPEEQVLECLADRQCLIVLDNCEHLLREAARLARRMLEQCPGVAILATSREPLGIPGEVVMAVPPLALPESRDEGDPARLLACDSVRLFVDRARSARRDLALTRETAPLVAMLCRRLDGMPLAIELAAARLKVLSLEQVVERLQDRFRLLAGGHEGGIARHQTLRATIDWSHEQLTPAEKVLYRRLSVHAGGAGLDAVEAICAGDGLEEADVIDVLTRLADKSLVQVAIEGGEARYRFLESIRQHALEKLEESGEARALRARHRDHHVALVARTTAELDKHAEPERLLSRLDRESENLRGAWAWTLSEGDAAAPCLLAFAASLGRYWEMRGRWREGSAAFEEALRCRRFEGDADVRARVIEWAAWFEMRQGEFARPLDRIGEALALLDPDGRPERRGSLLNMRGLALLRRGDVRDAESAHLQSLEAFRSVGDERGCALALSNMSTLALDQGDLHRARGLAEQALAMRRRLGDLRGLASSLANFGSMALRQRDLAAAREAFAEALDLSRRLGDRNLLASLAMNLGAVETEQGRLDDAERLIEESRAGFQASGARPMVARAELNLASLAGLKGDVDRAITRAERALELWRELGQRSGVADACTLLATARVRGRDLDGAARALGEALEEVSALGATWPAMELLDAAAALAVERGDARFALRLLDAATAQRESSGFLLAAHAQPAREALEQRALDAEPGASREPAARDEILADLARWLGGPEAAGPGG